LNAVEPAAWQNFGAEGTVSANPFLPPIANYYMTDAISRASETMAKCTEAFLAPAAKTGTHG
jgi:NADH-quinone oxidoreductase subunit G